MLMNSYFYTCLFFIEFCYRWRGIILFKILFSSQRRFEGCKYLKYPHSFSKWRKYQLLNDNFYMLHLVVLKFSMQVVEHHHSKSSKLRNTRQRLLNLVYPNGTQLEIERRCVGKASIAPFASSITPVAKCHCCRQDLSFFFSQ